MVADFGCGDAKLAQGVKTKVHSFDLVALNEHITACDMANVSQHLPAVVFVACSVYCSYAVSTLSF